VKTEEFDKPKGMHWRTYDRGLNYRATTKCTPARYRPMTTYPFHNQDWTEAERAEIRRLEKVCDASEHWTLECSHTDIGDPWCIIYDRQDDGIILHIARIERQYVVVWPREQRSAKTAIMAVAVDMALDRLKSQRRRAS
jgi:hypothetical protein